MEKSQVWNLPNGFSVDISGLGVVYDFLSVDGASHERSCGAGETK